MLALRPAVLNQVCRDFAQSLNKNLGILLHITLRPIGYSVLALAPDIVWTELLDKVTEEINNKLLTIRLFMTLIYYFPLIYIQIFKEILSGYSIIFRAVSLTSHFSLLGIVSLTLLREQNRSKSCRILWQYQTFLEQLTLRQPVIFITNHWKWRFIFLFTKARHCFLFRVKNIWSAQSQPII
jgi:hypothetical protein